MGGYASVGFLMLAGWTFLSLPVAWIYLAAAVAFEIWLAAKVSAPGRHPASAGEAPYHFNEEEARLVGRYRYYFTETGKARQLASGLAAIGLTSLVLVPWLAYKTAFLPAGLLFCNALAVVYLTRRMVPMGDTREVWDKIRAGNQ